MVDSHLENILEGIVEPRISFIQIKTHRSLSTELHVLLVFSIFKIKSLFNVKDSLPDRLCTHVVYKFSCATCNLLVTSVKQANIFLRAYMSTKPHQTDLHGIHCCGNIVSRHVSLGG